MIKPLFTNRLIIRRFAPTDLTDFNAYQADPKVREYQPGDAMSLEQARTYLASQAVLDEHEAGSWHGFAVEHKESGTVIGDIGIFLASAAEGDVGFQFHPAFHRRGYAYEAMTAFLPYVFDVLDVERVTAGCDEANLASRGLLVRLGMQERDATGLQTSCAYALTRTEWRARP